MKKIITVLLNLFVVFTLSGCLDDEIYTSVASLQQAYSEGVIKTADISTDGQYTLLSDGKQVCLWDNLRNKKKYPCLQGLESQLIELLGISTSKRYFYTSNRVNVHLYDLATGRLITVWSAGNNIINDIAMSDNERELIFGFRSGQASVVSVNNNNIVTFKPHRLDINSVSISADGSRALTGSSDKTAVLWNTRNGEAQHTFEHHSRVNHVVMSRDAKIAFTLDGIKDRYFWLLKIGKKFADLDSTIKFLEFNDAMFSDNNQWLVSVSPKQKIELWQVKTGKLIGQWQAYKTEDRYRASVIAVEFIGNNTLATVTSDGVYQTWPLPTESQS